MIHTIKDFKKEALKNPFFLRWNVISESDESITFQYIQPARKASCLLGFILLCFFIIPGILYLIFGGFPERKKILTISKIGDELIANGDDEAVKIANELIHKEVEGRDEEDEIEIVETTIKK